MIGELIRKAGEAKFEIVFDYSDGIYSGGLRSNDVEFYSFSSTSLFEVGSKLKDYLSICDNMKSVEEYINFVEHNELN